MLRCGFNKKLKIMLPTLPTVKVEKNVKVWKWEVGAWSVPRLVVFRLFDALGKQKNYIVQVFPEVSILQIFNPPLLEENKYLILFRLPFLA